MISIPVHGTTRIDDGIGVISVDSVYPTSPEDLWEAITVPERLARWFGDLVPEGNGATAYVASLTTGWSGTISVDECERPRLIRVRFQDETPTATTVSAVLEPTVDGTRLTVEERGLPTESLPAYVAGWHAQLDQLQADVAGAPTIEWRPRWEQLREHYRNADSDAR